MKWIIMQKLLFVFVIMKEKKNNKFKKKNCNYFQVLYRLRLINS